MATGYLRTLRRVLPRQPSKNRALSETGRDARNLSSSAMLSGSGGPRIRRGVRSVKTQRETAVVASDQALHRGHRVQEVLDEFLMELDSPPSTHRSPNPPSACT